MTSDQWPSARGPQSAAPLQQTLAAEPFTTDEQPMSAGLCTHQCDARKSSTGPYGVPLHAPRQVSPTAGHSSFPCAPLQARALPHTFPTPGLFIGILHVCAHLEFEHVAH
uniref:Uncharacterized protein n=1 Tax=Knipowitschia caucasica TaxID=637954 RepID=A0AAV2K418_KNICA